MIKIEEYMLLSKEERQKHLKLDEPCIDRGGYSTHLKGLLAHILDTTLPMNIKILVCHACHNEKCGNPYHIYWGTYRENRTDAKANGQKSIWEYTVKKYGLEKAKKIRCGIKGNKGNPGVARGPLSEETKKKISVTLRSRQGQGKWNSVGKWNSQYNTYWITKNRENKKIKVENLETYLSTGWKRGRFIEKKIA